MGDVPPINLSRSAPGGATTWPAALDLVVSRTGHERYRVLCAEDYRDHLGRPDPTTRDAYRALMVTLATGEPAPPPAPTLPPTPEDLALRAHLIRRPCCG
jgi:hypothetical protein